ncbi:MAG: uroporphyrinogen-III synthase [Pseudaminobacter sp.]|nr:uroporphyrinogen-III synthase [Pseudaminobacter sp.]
MRGRVLVTRPEPGASATARRLAQAGFLPVVLPLTETRALPVGPDAVSGDFDAVAITSVNAIRHAPAGILAALAGHHCFAVGAKTAAAAKRAGFRTVAAGSVDAGGLAMLIGEKAGAGTKILYFCGRVRFPTFEQSLEDLGLDVMPVETYDTVELNYSIDALAAALGGPQVDVVLLYSAKAAAAFAAIEARPELGRYLGGAKILALSGRVAAALSNSDPAALIASEPTEDALFRLLNREC